MKVLVINQDAREWFAYSAIARSCGCTVLCRDEADFAGIIATIRDQHIDALIFRHSIEHEFETLRSLRLIGVELPVILVGDFGLGLNEMEDYGVIAILPTPPEPLALRQALLTLEHSRIRNSDFAIIFRFLEACELWERSRMIRRRLNRFALPPQGTT